VRVGLRLAEVGEVVELDNMELTVGYWDSLADSLLDLPGTEEMLAFEVVATFEPLDDWWGAVDMLTVEPVAEFDSLDEPLEAVMAGLVAGFDSLAAGFDSLGDDLDTVMEGTKKPVAGFDSLVAGFESLDDAIETVMPGSMGLVADDTTDAVEMLTVELAGHLDDLEDILGM
jgi:hypothetical protein